MRLQDKILRQLNELIKRGEALSNLDRPLEQMTDEGLDLSAFVQWNTQCLNLLSRIGNGRIVHHEKFLEEENRGYGMMKKMGYMASRAYQSASVEIYYKVTILKALKADIESSNLFDEELLITADAFADILGQAEHLLSNGYKDAAAVLTGAILEATLRKLCDKNGITTPPNSTINSLNDLLLKSRTYNQLIHKQIIAWTQIRNDAAHGHFNNYDQKQVENMFNWVKDFVGRELQT